jgi:hypothetical protein
MLPDKSSWLLFWKVEMVQHEGIVRIVGAALFPAGVFVRVAASASYVVTAACVSASVFAEQVPALLVQVRDDHLLTN